MKRARRTACTKISSLGEPHQISGRAEEYGPAAKGQTHHLSTAISQVREAQLQYVSHWPGTWPVLVCLLVRRDTPAIQLHWQDPCAGERQRCALLRLLRPDMIRAHQRTSLNLITNASDTPLPDDCCKRAGRNPQRKAQAADTQPHGV